ncbi:pleckstrin homology domain-containing family A member 7-like isoform X2 [Dunckerocampus dactyliophorus]|uniref:pleckstrin homology domain-containing family A member 7-like isoform X2 n=1 Tax=Dunckerocampus dactyliophorus TaxID=161453 RepID=UPI00240725A8|nr:pleckstrin homology domain-containing family A member 7-like isoform X2 [Dunckerocampus dactyliophorus]
MAAPLGRDSLPEHWSYGVCGDGRVFFINDQTRETSWLHPRSSEPVNSGHMIRSDLPRGWEEGFTNEGASYFIKYVINSHNQRTTTFRHPVTGRASPDNVDYFLQEQQQGSRMMSQPGGEQHSSTTVSEASTTITTSSTVDNTSMAKGSRSSSKVHTFGKREQAIKRNPNVPVVVRGWLYKQDSSGMRLWKRKWFVLADFCLFYYKDSREEAVLGSIPLPSYVISPVGAEDHISRKYAFKASHTGMRSYIYKQSSVIGSQAEHTGMRTYYFSADTQEDMTTWLRAMNQAARMQNPVDTVIRPSDKLENVSVTQLQSVPQNNHHNINHHKAPECQRPVVHEVLLEPIHHDAEEHCSFHRDSPGTTTVEMDTQASLPSNPTASALPLPDQASSSAPVSRVPSRTPSRASSTLPPGLCTRNGLVETPSPILEPNGIAAGTYQRAPAKPEDNVHKEVRRRSTLEQVEQWVKVQKAELKGPPSRDNTLPRRTPPSQPKFTTLDAYQTLPKTPRPSPPLARIGEYKYAQDRLSHFRLTPELSGPGSNTVLQLYEWQQRQQYRHGSPTAPLYTPAPDYPYGARPPSTVPPSSSAKHNGPPRCVSVPPSPADIPPPGPPPGTSRTLSPARRPHTPADRVTVRPLGDASVLDTPFTVSPRRTKSQVFKASTIERRSMPPSNYITHTVSAPSLHGKTPGELTLLLIQLRRHQAKMAAARQHTLAQLQRHQPATNNVPTASTLLAAGPPPLTHLGLLGPPAPQCPCDSQADDTYVQLKKDLEYLDLKIRALEPLILAVHSLLLHCTAGPLRPLTTVAGSQTLTESGKPVKVAESDVDVKLSRLCEQDKILKDLEMRISSLKQDKDKLESVLDVSHQQMELYQEQPAHFHKIAYQQRLLQEDLVSIRAQISRLSTEMTHAWEDYGWLESSVEELRAALQAHMKLSATSQQDKTEMKRELWRIEDVMAGLSASKANYKVTIDSVHNPERKLVPSVSEPSVPSYSADIHPPLRSSIPSVFSQTLPRNSVPKWAEDSAPPRPPLPRLYDYEETPPAVPPLPKEASAIRHTSVRGLKRQSDERKRDRESGQYVVNGDFKADLRSFLSEPELPGISHLDSQHLDSKAGLLGTSWRLNHSDAVSSFVTLRRGPTPSVDRERPRSALECLSSEVLQYSGVQPRGRMSAEEQLERMKRHQRALVRERKRNLSQGERSSVSVPARRAASSPRLPSSTTDPPASVLDWREERLGAEGQSDEGQSQGREKQSGQWVTAKAVLVRETDVEPLDYDLDISRELSKPQKVPIPERYVEPDPEEPLSPEEEAERSRRTQRIKNLLSKSNVQNLQSAPLDLTELDLVLQQQERIMNASRALAAEASQKSKLVAAKAAAAVTTTATLGKT